MPVSRPFPIDVTLTAIAIAYKNEGSSLIYRQALPTVPVLSEHFRWNEYPISEAFTVPELQVGRKGRVGEVEFRVEEQKSNTNDYGLDDVIPVSDIREAEQARAANASKYDPVGSAVEGLTNLLELGREVRAANVVQNPDNFDAARRLVIAGADDKFSSFATSDPYEVMNDAMRKPLVYRANTIVMGEVVWESIKRHPKLIKAVKGGLSEEGAITRKQFSELMEINPENLLVGVSIVNASNKGQPVDLVPVWGNSIEFLYLNKAKQSGMDGIMTWGFTAECSGRIAGQMPAPEVGLEGGTRVRVGEKVRELVCAKSLGYQIQNPV